MNILIVNHYAGSPRYGMEFRVYYLAKEWVKSGHNVTILAASYSHLRKENPNFENITQIENIDEINYIWHKTPNYLGNGLSRVKNMFSFIFQINKLAKKYSETYKPDVVIASSTYPLDIKPAKKIAKLSHAKLVFEIHDLWPLTPMELGGYSKFHPYIALLQYFENQAYKYSNAVISILPKTKEHTINHGLNTEKWFHVPNGIVLDEWENIKPIPQEINDTFTNLKNDKKILIGYAGGHAISNALDSFIDASELLKNDEKFVFVLVGDGIEKQRLIKKAENLKNVIFLNSVNKNSVPDLLNNFDYLFIGWNKSKLYRFGISPNKIFDYMMAQKPIIHAVEAGNDIVKEANAGISCQPENPQEIVNAIIKLQNMSSEELNILGKNGKNYILKHHTYNVLAQQFLDILKNC
jgi:glycosyltransferase involved in cell wall biosynthesis